MRLCRTIVVISLLLGTLTLGPAGASEAAMDERLAAAEQVYRSDGPEAALPEFSRLLKIFESGGDKRNVAVAEGFIGACHWRLGNYGQARRHLDIALALKQEIGDQVEVGKTLNLLGLLEWDLGNFDAAMEKFRQASVIGRQAGDARLHGATLNNLSLVYDELGDYQTSLAQYRQVLEIYSNADFPRGMGDTLGNIGGVYLLLGQFSEAARFYLRALEISERLESRAAMSQDHGNLGLAYSGMGRTDLALQHFDEALALARQAGLKKEQGQWLRGKANAQIQAGRYDLALESLGAAVETLASVGAQAQLLDALHDMGELHLLLGDLVSAEQYFQRAITLARGIDMPRVVTLNLLSLGDFQFRHRRLDAAAALYEQALQRATEAGEQTSRCWALLRLARVHLKRLEFEDGEKISAFALERARDIDAQGIETEALYMQAEFELAQERTAKALKTYEDARNSAERVGDPELQWQIEFGRAMALEQAGRTEEAVAALKAAVVVIESVRSRLQENRFRAGYMQDKHQVYIKLVRLQMELSRTSDAFETAERLRAWSFTEQTGLGAGGLSEEQRRASIELRERIRQLQRNLEIERSREVPQRRQLAIDTFSTELLLAEREFQALLDDTASQETGSVTAETAGEAAVRQRLDREEALVEYLVGEDLITIFVLRPKGVHAVSVAADTDNLHSRLELLRSLLERRDSERWRMPAASLADTLLTPILKEDWLRGVTHLYVVPHDMLNYLPFALLPVGESPGQEPVIARYTLAYLPAASVLATGTDVRPRTRPLLALAPEISRLAHAQEEVQSIGALFSPDAELLLGRQATESRFKASAGEYGMLHLATHGYFNRFNPLLSGLQLEADGDNDGLLEVHEILDLKLDSALVTLSACKTGLGSGYFSTLPAGDDFVGMTRAFLQVGSASVLATLWEVEDRSTVDLMRAFYAHLESRDSVLDKAGALANAQRTLIASPTYQHPYYWAPFVLVGSMSRQGGAQG